MRELVVLGTASAVPTRARNHNGYLLRWDGEGLLFDPGEGTQRQLTLAGAPASSVTRICLTHVHGDHCLGLPGVLSRMVLDGVEHPVHLHFPASGADVVGAVTLADDVDLLLVECTYGDEAADLAEAYRHLTAGQAGAVAAAGGARSVVLTHFSGRYTGTDGLLAQARARAGDRAVHAADDGDRFGFPPRRDRMEP